MNLIAARSSARAVFEAHAKDSSLFHVGRALLGMHAEIAERGAMTLGKGPTSPAEDRPDISYRVEAIDDEELEGAGDIDALLALIPPAPRRTAEIAAAVDAESVAKQLTHAFGIYVERVRLISVADPYADVSWMTDEALDADETDFASTLDSCLDESVEGAFWGRLHLGLQPKLLRELKEDGIERIESDVVMRFSDGITAAIRSAIGRKVSERRLESVRDNVMDALVAFAGIAAIDDRHAGLPLGHLVRILASALPLGMKKDEPGTWLFLVA